MEERAVAVVVAEVYAQASRAARRRKERRFVMLVMRWVSMRNQSISMGSRRGGRCEARAVEMPRVVACCGSAGAGSGMHTLREMSFCRVRVVVLFWLKLERAVLNEWNDW